MSRRGKRRVGEGRGEERRGKKREGDGREDGRRGRERGEKREKGRKRGEKREEMLLRQIWCLLFSDTDDVKF